MNKQEYNQSDFKLGERWAVYGVIVNLILTIIKWIAGVVGGSSAIVADALNSAFDVIASIVVFVSLKIAKKPADQNHPYGHGKAEAIATSIVGIMLFAAAIQIMKAGIEAIKVGLIQTPDIICLYVALLTIAIKLIMYKLTYRVGKTINSPSTIANAMDHKSDTYASFATLTGISGALLGFPVLDQIAGVVVSIFILKMGIEILKDGIKQIMDTSTEYEKIEQIKKIVLDTDGVEATHDIRVRQSGSHYIVDLDICVDKNVPLYKAHEIGDIVRSNIHNSVDKIYEVRVHVDPKI